MHFKGARPSDILRLYETPLAGSAIARSASALHWSKMFPAFYAAIRRIPKGKVSTYGAVARAAGFAGSARQVVWALNVKSVRLPWQRVVGADGKILLTGAHGIDQRLLLEHEGVKFQGGRAGMKVDMAECEFIFVDEPKSKTSRAVKSKPRPAPART